MMFSCGDSSTQPAPDAVSHAGIGMSTPASTANQTPAQVADAFAQALNTDNEARWMSLLTAAAVEEMKNNASAQFNGDNFDSWTIGEPAVEEEHASVPMTVTGERGEQQFDLKLRRETGRWLVYGMAMPMGMGIVT